MFRKWKSKTVPGHIMSIWFVYRPPIWQNNSRYCALSKVCSANLENLPIFGTGLRNLILDFCEVRPEKKLTVCGAWLLEQLTAISACCLWKLARCLSVSGAGVEMLNGKLSNYENWLVVKLGNFLTFLLFFFPGV